MATNWIEAWKQYVPSHKHYGFKKGGLTDMCGRFALNENPRKFAEHFNLSGDLEFIPLLEHRPFVPDLHHH